MAYSVIKNCVSKDEGIDMWEIKENIRIMFVKIIILSADYKSVIQVGVP
jgi:hypothetical protein